MAKLIGLKDLINAKEHYLNYNQFAVKGINGEIIVANALKDMLGNDTIVVAHPQIGKLEPDFVIFSPVYGVRIVEVKNWNLNSISDVGSNGMMVINGKRKNPFTQVRAHAENVNSFINSNYRLDAYNYIGYLVIHIGFDFQEIQEKFNFDWNEQSLSEYKRFHLFKNDIATGLENKIANAIKYRTPINTKQFSDAIIEIGKKLDVYVTINEDEEIAFQSEILENNSRLVKSNKNFKKKIDQLEEKIDQSMVKMSKKDSKEVQDSNRVLLQLKEELESINLRMETVSRFNSEYTQKINEMDDIEKKIDKIYNQMDNATSSNKRKYSKKLIILLCLIVLMTSIWLPSLDIKSLTKNEEDLTLESFIKEYDYGVEDSFVAKVEKFEFNSKTGNKYLVLRDGESLINAVIFNGTETPFIVEGKRYLITGELNNYNGSVEILVNRIDEF